MSVTAPMVPWSFGRCASLHRAMLCVLLLTMGHTATHAGSGPDTVDLKDLEWKGVVWQSLSSGAGGNIQDLFLDPDRPGRLFFSSDMEGAYESADYGETWHYIGEGISNSYVNQVVADPRSSGRLYAGTISCLEISDDGGKHWRKVPSISDSIGVIAVQPGNGALIIACPGQRQRWAVRHPEHVEAVRRGEILGPWGKRTVYVSRDHGQTWAPVVCDPVEGRRDVLSCQFDPSDAKIVYLGTINGVYRSRDAGGTWQKIPDPPDAGDGVGCAVSPDGKTLYAAFRVPSHGKPAIRITSQTSDMGQFGYSHLFGTSTNGIAWTDLSEGAEGFCYAPRYENTNYWRPVVDPRSAGQTHRLLMGTYRPQHGLWEVNVDWSNPKPKAVWKQILGYETAAEDWSRKTHPFDIGWEIWNITAEDYEFTPTGWPAMIIATGGQTAFKTDLIDADYPNRWRPIYTWRVREVDGVPMYRTRGAQCEFVFDADALGDYAVASVGDNCIHESFDGGYSWTMESRPGGRQSSRSNACRILRGLRSPIVLVHAAQGWGAAAESGTVYAKRLDPPSPKGKWIPIAGGPDRIAGVPDLLVNQIVQDPHDPKRVYLGTWGRGVYEISDIEAHLQAVEAGQKAPPAKSPTLRVQMPRPAHVQYESTGLAVDPNDPDVIWVAGHKSLWRGQRTGPRDEQWQWSKVQSDGWSGSFAVWDESGRTQLAVAVNDGNRGRIVHSGDDGKTWSPLVDFDACRRLRETPDWWTDSLRVDACGLAAKDGQLFFAYVTPRGQGRKVFGYFRARVSAGKLQGVDDLTADAPWPYPVRSRIIAMDGKDWLYLATRGATLWRRPIPSEPQVGATSPATQSAGHR